MKLFTITTIGGKQHTITEEERNSLSELLVLPKEECPRFIKIKSQNLILSSSSITSIEEGAKDEEWVMSKKEEQL